jgi:Anti-sigma factor NepR
VAKATVPTALDNAPPGALRDEAASTRSSPKSVTGDVGTALRDAFRATVDEEIPSEMLDLLRRLD